MRIAVYDEDLSDNNMIISIIDSYVSKNICRAATYGYSVLEDLVSELKSGGFFDIIFLNISKNKDYNSSIMWELRTNGCCNAIILLNSENGRSTEESNYFAVEYHKKTYSAIGFMTILDGIFDELVKESYTLKTKNGIIRIPINDISFIESNNSKCTLHTTDGKKYVLYKTLNEIEHELTDKRFLRCHRSYIVNMNYIISVENDIELINGEKILIRQRGKKAIIKAICDYLS